MNLRQIKRIENQVNLIFLIIIIIIINGYQREWLLIQRKKMLAYGEHYKHKLMMHMRNI